MWRFKLKWTWPSKNLALSSELFWKSYNFRLKKLGDRISKIVEKRFLLKYQRLRREREKAISKLVEFPLVSPNEDDLNIFEEEELDDFIDNLVDDQLDEDDYFEFINSYGFKLKDSPEARQREAILKAEDPESAAEGDINIIRPLVFQDTFVAFSFDDLESDFEEEYWGFPYDFDFADDYFFTEFLVFIFFVYFFIHGLIAILFYLLYIELLDSYIFSDLEDMQNLDILDEEEDVPVFEDEDDLFSEDFVDPGDFDDFEVDNFSKEDLDDFYFFYNFSSKSFKYFSKFNKKFKGFR